MVFLASTNPVPPAPYSGRHARRTADDGGRELLRYASVHSASHVA